MPVRYLHWNRVYASCASLNLLASLTVLVNLVLLRVYSLLINNLLVARTPFARGRSSSIDLKLLSCHLIASRVSPNYCFDVRNLHKCLIWVEYCTFNSLVLTHDHPSEEASRLLFCEHLIRPRFSCALSLLENRAKVSDTRVDSCIVLSKCGASTLPEVNFSA